ncbi:MAG: hypothetical protein EAZ60_27025 [Oscillatoriales cyanobacterium]|nr:MAG: hypothetical protein EAZ60_27025 [Oscillatoriales cyanobacterium]
MVLTYLIVFASSLEAIALALSPGNFRIKLPLGEAQQSDIKSGIFTSQSPPNAAPDTASTLPRSAFYCFYGTAERTQLNLTVVDTYDGSRSPYSVNLQQYHPISAVSDNDRRILGICKEAHKQQVWGN